MASITTISFLWQLVTTPCPLFPFPTKPSLVSHPSLGFLQFPEVYLPGSPSQSSHLSSVQLLGFVLSQERPLLVLHNSLPFYCLPLSCNSPSFHIPLSVLPNESSLSFFCLCHLPLKKLSLKFSLKNHQGPSLLFQIPCSKCCRNWQELWYYTVSQEVPGGKFLSLTAGRWLHTSLKISIPRASACWMFI